MAENGKKQSEPKNHSDWTFSYLAVTKLADHVTLSEISFDKVSEDLINVQYNKQFWWKPHLKFQERLQRRAMFRSRKCEAENIFFDAVDLLGKCFLLSLIGSSCSFGAKLRGS